MKRTASHAASSGHPPILRIYLRRSRGEEQQAESIEAQRAVCERFAASRGMDWDGRLEYIDSKRSGDNFAGRADLQRLLRETRAGDIILTRDSSRVGRDALECAIVTRNLVSYSGAKLFYAATGEEARAATALDAGMNVMRGMGAQMELEGIRSRTRDALRLRAQQGFATSRPPYGYRNVRVDASGKPVAEQWNKNAGKVRREIDPARAPIVVRIFKEFIAGAGTCAIARGLNRDGIRAANGGTWGPDSIPFMIANSTYRGIVVYGMRRAVHVAGERHLVSSDDRVILKMPELAIVDDETWEAAQAALHGRKRAPRRGNKHAAKHPLVGVARCDACGGSIMAATGPRYACSAHTRKGPTVCRVAVRQRAHDVETPLRDYLLQHVLLVVEDSIKRAVADYCAKQAKVVAPDMDAIDAEIATLRKQQKRLVALAVETDDPIPEIADKLRVNKDRLAALESRKREAKRAPKGASLRADLEAAVMERLRFLRGWLTSDRDNLGRAFRSLFPKGLRFVDSGDGVWEIVGTASVGGNGGGSGGSGESFTTGQQSYTTTEEPSSFSLLGNYFEDGPASLNAGGQKVMLGNRGLQNSPDTQL